jgi:hypothetical protein
MKRRDNMEGTSKITKETLKANTKKMLARAHNQLSNLDYSDLEENFNEFERLTTEIRKNLIALIIVENMEKEGLI